ncbi:hypothetical protein V8D89_001806 [Ganoderma adspersum]
MPMPKPGQTPTYPAPEDSFLDCSFSNADNVNSDSIQRDSTIWFEDGNIVAIAQNTAFRFHKGVLALHSQVFRDLFSFDGCPVVHVTDTSYDFRELLRELYCGGVTHLNPSATVTFSVLAALARLSHKYQLDQLLDAVLHRLRRTTFMTHFDAWARSGGFHADLSPLALRPRHAVEALNLFRRLGAPARAMVPVALYGCCQLPAAALLAGTARDDGCATQERLAPRDLELCFEAKARLTQATVRVTMALADFVEARISLGCAAPKLCLDSLAALLSSTQGTMRFKIGADALNGCFGKDMDTYVYLGRICGVCAKALRGAHQTFLRDAWEALPWMTQTSIEDWDCED